VRDSEDVPAGPVDGASLIDEIVREGARRMLAAALEAEVARLCIRPWTTTSTISVVWLRISLIDTN
jgi:hypothetical protein